MKNVPAAGNAGLQGKPHFLARARRFLDYGHFLEHFLAGLRAADGLLPVKTAELLDDLLLVPDLSLIVQVSMHLTVTEFLFRSCICCVISRKDGTPGVLQLDDLRYDPVEKIPVVRDNKDRSLIGKQETLKPAGAGDIQVVCWLI